ncbi:serine/arginine repetitive matrix protein 2-like isoform X30 [Penaeus japonicus]|uniref:serine/arginine repetitive matrix protein 2-like isoform X30 n=1 Tax=Penaeus japonicus TaxID=27405 RepID=UPI001C70D70C|nr:serine/arginine repetitive matrix protein 2-like isoform X30 [Penaeus japonicus]
MANVGVVGQTSVMTQSFHHQEVKTQHSERLERLDLKTPEGDLGDVEADFQSLVNEMARDSSSVKSFSSSTQESFSSKQVMQQSFSSSVSSSKTSSSVSMNGGSSAPKLAHVPAGPPKEPPPPPPSAAAATENGIVTARLAQVIPDDDGAARETQRGGGESEIVVEQPIRVRDRIKKIERQLSTEDIPSGPPEVIMPRGRSGSVRNLAEQFMQADEGQQQQPPPAPSVNAAAFKNVKDIAETFASESGVEASAAKAAVAGEFKSVKEMVSTFSQQEESTSTKKVEGDFKSVKETASIFQEPIQPMAAPIRPPPAFLTDGETTEIEAQIEPVDPVAVLPPATMARNPPPVPPPKPPAPAAMPAPEPAPAPSPPRPEPPVSEPPAPAAPEPVLEPAPAPIYDYAPAPEPAPAPTPAAPEPIVPAPEPAPAVPPRDAKPTEPPPVPWRKNREEKAAPPPAEKPAKAEKAAPPPAPEKPAPVAAALTTTETDKVFEEALAEINKYSETLSQTSTESRSTSAETVVQQPIQYSAQVKCEVRSRVTTPEVPAQVQEQQQISSSQTTVSSSSTRRSRSETRSSTAASASSLSASSVGNLSSSASKTSATKTSTPNISSSKAAAKPPKFEPSEVTPPKFSLLRSASTGSVSSAVSSSSMKHAGSDKDLPKFSVKKVKNGLASNTRVWSPGRTDDKESSGPSKIDVPDLPSFKDQPTVWSPSRAGSASPSLGRKEYRKITYEGTLQKRPSQENVTTPRPEDSFAWKDREIERALKSPTSTLPKVQNPTVTLLQKKRDDPHSTSDGQIPGKRPEYLKGDEYGPAYKPEDKLYTIKREYESEDEEGSRRFAVLGPKKVHGVGPTTNDGVPTTLKSGVKSEHQGEWYRRMFDSLHKVKDDDHVIIKYKCPRARYGGYMSEPEGYDSDVGSSRYATLDRRRMHHFDADPMSSSLPRDYLADLDPFFRNSNRYVHQPGRIEDYVPGHSSLSEKEHKKNPEAEIKLEAKSQEPPPVSVNHRLGSQKMSMTHALKESGYESDSTLVFRKREDARRQPPDPRKTSQVYRQIQRGGDIPLTGLQKSAPPKQKDDYYVVYSDLDLGLHHPSLSDLAYAHISPRAMSPPAKPPVPTFGERKRSAPSKVSLAPSPPRRISSKWHPSLMKGYKDRPPIPSPRSTSAERVRETRALYSTWHREKVARSREKLGSSPARTNSLGRTSSSAKQSSEVRENFLKERRAVSESRFTIEDREKSPPRRTPSPPKASSPVRQSDGREKLHHRTSLKDVSSDKAGIYRSKVQEPYVTKGHSRSLSADAQRKWSNTSAESGMYSVTRHTVSSMNKIRRPSQQNPVDSRSSSAEGTCRRRRSSCLSPEPQLASRKSPVGRKDSRHRESPYSDVSLEVADDKKLKQSESFDTTQSNETGYSSMLDLSPSPVPDRRAEERRARKKSESPVRPHSAPAPRRSRYSHSFSEQRNKWEAITRGEAVGRRSRSPSRSTSPLRSLQLVRQVSSSFRNIPVEIWSESRRSKSLEVLTPSPHSHPQRYRQYILELRNAAPRNARISQLRRLFTSLERVHRLERSVSTVELSAADNRAHEIIDFETWKSMREKERKALEYNVLMKELNVAQKEREFLYKVTPEKKWAGDCRLRGRDVSVPELREKFDSLTDNSSEISQKRRQELENSKDTYRGLWRGSSVRDVSRMYESPERSRSSRRGSSLSLSREDSGIRARGLWTSLSLEQVNAFRDHLTEIYGSMQNVRSWRERKQMSMERTPNKSQRELAKYSVDVSETGRVLADKLRTLHVRPPPEQTRRLPSRHSSPPRAAKSSSNVHHYEDQRRQLSKQLSIEFQEKVKEQKSGRRLESTPAMLDSLQVPDHPTSVSPESLSRSSPRTCYSLDISDSSEPNSLNSGDQFLLVVQKPGGHGRSNSLPPEQGSEADSSDSEMSVRTVVHKDVAGKVKFFEKRARRNSRSSERHSSRGSRLNIDEVPHYATLPTRLKQQSQNKLFSPNYLPERSVSSVNLANKAELAWRIYDKANPVSSSSIQRLSDQPKDKRDQVNPTSHSRSYLYHVKTGDVNRLKDRFESPEDARRRARSLPDMNGSLSRVTPSGKTVVRGQEAGDVQYMRAKYEAPRRSRSPERWQPSRDEYLPKSKLTNTLQSLASRSPAFCEPATVERLARRDSVEKAVLRRVHTGNVEASVDRLESQQSGSGVSIIGQMYTSAPSVNELANISTLVPPRPPPPLMGPQKPQRMAVRSNIQPLLTSTPTPSPRDARAVHKQRALQVTEPVCYPPTQLHPPPGASATFTRSSSSDYNADAHRPKSRYVPPESYGSPGGASQARGSWTQSLERPHRVTRAMTNTNPPAPSRGSSHCYTLRRHHQVHHAHHTPRAEHHSPSQPHPYSNTYSQITKPYQPYSHSPGRDQNYNNKAVSWKGARVLFVS